MPRYVLHYSSIQSHGTYAGSSCENSRREFEATGDKAAIIKVTEIWEKITEHADRPSFHQLERFETIDWKPKS